MATSSARMSLSHRGAGPSSQTLPPINLPAFLQTTLCVLPSLTHHLGTFMKESQLPVTKHREYHQIRGTEGKGQWLRAG